MSDLTSKGCKGRVTFCNYRRTFEPWDVWTLKLSDFRDVDLERSITTPCTAFERSKVGTFNRSNVGAFKVWRFERSNISFERLILQTVVPTNGHVWTFERLNLRAFERSNVWIINSCWNFRMFKHWIMNLECPIRTPGTTAFKHSDFSRHEHSDISQLLVSPGAECDPTFGVTLGSLIWDIKSDIPDPRDLRSEISDVRSLI